MTKQIKFYVSYAILLLSAISINIVSGDEEEQTVTRDALAFTIPNPFGAEPIFETNDQNGRVVNIHIPWIFDMEFWLRGPVSNFLYDSRFETTILSGVISYTHDRMTQPDGNRYGPWKLTTFGYPLYDNKEVATQQGAQG